MTSSIDIFTNRDLLTQCSSVYELQNQIYKDMYKLISSNCTYRT